MSLLGATMKKRDTVSQLSETNHFQTLSPVLQDDTLLMYLGNCLFYRPLNCTHDLWLAVHYEFFIKFDTYTCLDLRISERYDLHSIPMYRASSMISTIVVCSGFICRKELSPITKLILYCLIYWMQSLYAATLSK